MKRLPPLVLLHVLLATPAAAQLRPLQPADWHDHGHSVACGAGYYRDVGSGLAGSRGRLSSFGDCALVADLGGVRIRAAGVVWRRFAEDTAYADPFRHVLPAEGGVRSDWGDLMLETLVPVRFSSGWLTGLRFGVRVPINDNRLGLERDKTDLHVIAMGGYETRRVAGYVEAGLGVNGTRVTWREQQDVLIYSARFEYGLSSVARLRLAALGHVNDRTERGNENQGEVRAGVRLGDGTWLDAELVAGYTEASPSWGIRLRFGRRFGG